MNTQMVEKSIDTRPPLPVLQSMQEKDEFARIMADPKRNGLPVEKIAQLFNISVRSVYNKIQDEDIAKLIKKYRTQVIVSRMPRVDDGVLKRAECGDVKAAELIYERWDDYDPKGKNATNIQINFTQDDGKI